MSEIEKPVKQIVKPEKFRGVADGERKITCVETTIEIEKQQKMKQKSPMRNENSQMTYQENPSKISAPNTTGIPKPMAAVKGTSKIASSTDLSPLKTKSPSIPRIPTEMDKQKREDVCVALVSPMRTSITEGLKEDEKNLNIEMDKKIKDIEEEELMNVKPMSPLLNGYRLTNNPNPHFTHPGYITNGQPNKNNYYKVNSNVINLESIDLAMGYLSDGELVRSMNNANLMQNGNNGYVSDGNAVYAKRKDVR